jgi:predicted anti-sigma-YlaC factor YlaD
MSAVLADVQLIYKFRQKLTLRSECVVGVKTVLVKPIGTQVTQGIGVLIGKLEQASTHALSYKFMKPRRDGYPSK